MINLLIVAILGVLTVHAQFPSPSGMSSPMMPSMMSPPSSASSALPAEATPIIQNVMRSPTSMSRLADMLYYQGYIEDPYSYWMCKNNFFMCMSMMRTL